MLSGAGRGLVRTMLRPAHRAGRPSACARQKPLECAYITFGSLNASISPLNASTGTQLQNTFLSP
jgi:hypothetical protein